MLLLMIERGERIDRVIFADTGLEFPQIYDSVVEVDEHLWRERRMRIDVVRAETSFEDFMFRHELRSAESLRRRAACGMSACGLGWPSHVVRWCTGKLKLDVVKAARRLVGENVIEAIGFAADERERMKADARHRYPLIEYGIDEAGALKICHDRGFDFGGIYEHMRRASCWCCPLSSIGALRTLRREFPELWMRLRALDRKAHAMFGDSPQGRFAGKGWAHFERRFAAEEKAREASDEAGARARAFR